MVKRSDATLSCFSFAIHYLGLESSVRLTVLFVSARRQMGRR
jgi:hypothetical protein